MRSTAEMKCADREHRSIAYIQVELYSKKTECIDGISLNAVLHALYE